MAKKKITIEETPHVIDEHLLDIIGNEFKFDHVKGMAEWLKNSVDAYFRKDMPQSEQHVIFRFTDQGVTSPTVECVDFVGMEQKDIDGAFKRWGDPNAAKGGRNRKMFGGHGNGGKFYMRQMFEESRFVTYRNGLLNIFGFSENKKYGYAKDYQNKKMSPQEALDFAEIASVPIPSELRKKILAGETGFTVIQGVGPVGVRGKFKVTKEMERFKNHPQSRRILLRSNVFIVYNDKPLYDTYLKPDELEPLEKFEEPRVVEIPEKLTTVVSGEEIEVAVGNAKYPAGRLILRTSAEPLAKGGKLGELNRIDILGEIGVIGSYQLTEMGVTSFPHAAFIYGDFGPAGEGEASILEDPENDCVSNDRAKLVQNEMTQALIEWIAHEVDKLAGEIAALEREKQKANQKKITSKFNDVLNEWKNKHMKKIMSELFGGDAGAGLGGGGGGSGSEVSPPPNGFDFKYPVTDVQIEIPTKATLKISVPEALPVGAVVSVSVSDNGVEIEEQKYPIRSEYLKQTPDGKDVAFLQIGIVGKALGAETTLTAKAGKFSATTIVRVSEQKENKSGSKAFPRVLLSGNDPDPLGLAAGGTLVLGEREPVVYQRPQDVAQGLYWINTASPMASKISDKFTFESVQWRNFLFERYVDIFVKESIHELEKKDPDNFNADSVDQKISDVVKRIHESAKSDLEDFLFEESYVVQNE